MRSCLNWSRTVARLHRHTSFMLLHRNHRCHALSSSPNDHHRTAQSKPSPCLRQPGRRLHRRQCMPPSATLMPATAFTSHAFLSLETESVCAASKAAGCLHKNPRWVLISRGALCTPMFVPAPILPQLPEYH